MKKAVSQWLRNTSSFGSPFKPRYQHSPMLFLTSQLISDMVTQSDSHAAKSASFFFPILGVTLVWPSLRWRWCLLQLGQRYFTLMTQGSDLVRSILPAAKYSKYVAGSTMPQQALPLCASDLLDSPQLPHHLFHQFLLAASLSLMLEIVGSGCCRFQSGIFSFSSGSHLSQTFPYFSLSLSIEQLPSSEPVLFTPLPLHLEHQHGIAHAGAKIGFPR